MSADLLYPDERPMRTVTIDHIAGIFTLQVDLHFDHGETVGDIRLYADPECQKIIADDIRFLELSESQRTSIFDAIVAGDRPPTVQKIMVRPILPTLAKSVPW